MKYKEALEKFNTDNTVCIVVETKDGLMALTDNNFAGGCCSCCNGCECGDDLAVVRVVDMATMAVFYEAE